MKTNLLRTGVVLFTSTLICFSCHQKPKVQENKGTNSKGQTASVEVGIFDAVKLKDDIVGIIKTAPKPKDLANFINETGATYITNFSLPLQDDEKYIAQVDMCLASGMFSFDTLYAKAFNRYDVALQTREVIRKLNRKLGLDVEMAKMDVYNERIKQNKDNSDSLNTIIPEMMNQVPQVISTGGHPAIYGLTFVGANIEGLYILTQVALMAKDNSKFLQLIAKQKERVSSNYMLLELMAADASVAPIFEKMKPIMAYFTKNQEFTSSQLSEVALLIEQLRKEIVK